VYIVYVGYIYTIAIARNKRAELLKTWPVYTRCISTITAIVLELLHEYNSICYKYVLYNLCISAAYANI
jgi:hypothetical protein